MCGYIMYFTVYQADLAYINLHLYKWVYVYLIKSNPPEANTAHVLFTFLILVHKNIERPEKQTNKKN